MKKVYCLLIFALFLSLTTVAQEENEMKPGRALRVGVKISAPFVLKNETGAWQGISINLWEEIAEKLGIEYSFEEYELTELLDKIANKEIDIAVAALTITPEREEKMDFTHSFYSSGLGIAVPKKLGWAWMGILQRFFSSEFLSVLGFLLCLLLLVGGLVWFFERKENAEQFGGKASTGLFSGLWWSAVTMTTVGYGDKAPLTAGGRIIGLVWMFASIIIISGITAAITSALTVNQLQSSIQNPQDLVSVRVATVTGSTSENYLRKNRVRRRAFETPMDALRSVAESKLEAMVYDAPILKYLTLNNFENDVEILPVIFEQQLYGLALQQNSEFREPINRILLQTIESTQWKDILFRYIGADSK